MSIGFGRYVHSNTEDHAGVIT